MRCFPFSARYGGALWTCALLGQRNHRRWCKTNETCLFPALNALNPDVCQEINSGKKTAFIAKTIRHRRLSEKSLPYPDTSLCVVSGGPVQCCINFEVIGAWILCQDMAKEGGNAVALLTDDNAVLAQKAGAYYSIMNEKWMKRQWKSAQIYGKLWQCHEKKEKIQW